ncbi:MAG: F0F1 ATP synthase subunit B [Rhodospirillales bacterium]|nr:F0F1 ATP synthase subunit B [Alphaproteobacteria bacterium]MBL6947278.1 F0F1 ATP synthase subunit B [Rhodospirillales bacterium]
MAFLHDPTFWVLVAFVIFIAAAARPIIRLATAGLDKRADKIRNDLEEAEKLRQEAQDLLAGYQRKQRDAIQEAEDIVQHAREEAERLAVQGRENLEAALERRKNLALERIAQAEAQAIDIVRAKTVDLALDATREFLTKELKGKQADALIDQAIKDLPEKLH